MNNNIFRLFPYDWKRFHGFIGNIKYIPHMFKWAHQRIMRGYADCDVWSFDGFLATVIPAGLRELAQLDSYPFSFGTHEEWNKWLIETAELFEEIYHEDFIILGEEYQQKINMAFDRLKEQFGNLWD